MDNKYNKNTSDGGGYISVVEVQIPGIQGPSGDGSARNAVLYDKEQSLTTSQQNTARSNINAASASEMTKALQDINDRINNAGSNDIPDLLAIYRKAKQ